MSYVHTGRCVGKLALIYRDNFKVSLPPKSCNRWSQKFRCYSESVACGDLALGGGDEDLRRFHNHGIWDTDTKVIVAGQLG